MLDGQWGTIRWMSDLRVRSDAGLGLIHVMVLMVRLLVAGHGYSGQGTPPMFGDYEAQRHWMELSIHLPAREWYTYDVQYWGLDYPPLSAYHAWLVGSVLHKIFPEMVELDRSRGFESADSKLYMRWSVILSDVFVYLPIVYVASGAIFWARRTNDVNVASSTMTSAAGCYLFVSIVPALILIDHGHFQYNGVSLGLAILAIHFLGHQWDVAACVAFTCAVLFKHMVVYYVPVMVGLLMGRMRQSSNPTWYFLRCTSAVTVTTTLIFLPWVMQGFGDVLTVISRLFPLQRGLFEDKVANIWCSLSLILKLRNLFSNSTLAEFSSVLSLLFAAPFAIGALWQQNARGNEPLSRSRLVRNFSGSALACFLFGYQVHEKQILLPLIPLAFLINEAPFLVLWFSMVGSFSLLPLLSRDGLSLPYGVTQIIQLLVLFTGVENTQLSVQRTLQASVAGGLILHGLLCFAPRIERYPDIYVYLISIYSCAHFCILYCILLVDVFHDFHRGQKYKKV